MSAGAQAQVDLAIDEAVTTCDAAQNRDILVQCYTLLDLGKKKFAQERYTNQKFIGLIVDVKAWNRFSEYYIGVDNLNTACRAAESVNLSVNTLDNYYAAHFKTSGNAQMASGVDTIKTTRDKLVKLCRQEYGLLSPLGAADIIKDSRPAPSPQAQKPPNPKSLPGYNNCLSGDAKACEDIQPAAKAFYSSSLTTASEKVTGHYAESAALMYLSVAAGEAGNQAALCKRYISEGVATTNKGLTYRGVSGVDTATHSDFYLLEQTKPAWDMFIYMDCGQ